MPAFFDDPVVIWLDPKRPDFGVKVLQTVPDGLKALQRSGIREALDTASAPLWRSASDALVEADIEPSPTNVRRASQALLCLVKSVAPVPSGIRLRVSPRGLREQVAAFFAMPETVSSA